MRWRVSILMGALVVALLIASPPPALADCASPGGVTWPAFGTVGPGAATVLVGEVTGALSVERGSGTITRFRLTVREVMRGEPVTVIEFQKAIVPAVAACVGPLNVEIGDALALALGSSAPIDPEVIGVAAISDDPAMLRRARPMGVEPLTLADVRSIAGRSPSPWPAVAMAAIIAVAFLLRSRRSAAGRAPAGWGSTISGPTAP